ncbi:hypothetical protein ES703_100868 [subsurface metagenome]
MTPSATQLDINLYSDEFDDTEITAGKFFYGTSKTSLIHSIAADFIPGMLKASKAIPGLSAGVKYFIQFRPDTGENCEGAYSGIYHGTPTA